MALFIYLLCVIGPFVFLIVYAIALYSKCEEIPKSVYEEDEECVDPFYTECRRNDIYMDPRYGDMSCNFFHDDDD